MSQSVIKLVHAPCITEKSSLLAEVGQYVFRTGLGVTKNEIAKAIEKMFEVKVCSVRTCHVTGKGRRYRGRNGRRSDWKKVYVTLAEGQSINLSGI